MLRVAPEVLAVSSAVETEGTASLGGAAAAATAPMTGVVPAGPSPALVLLASAAAARGVEALGALAMLTGAKGLFGSTVAVSGVGYEAVDAAASTALTI